MSFSHIISFLERERKIKERQLFHFWGLFSFSNFKFCTVVHDAVLSLATAVLCCWSVFSNLTSNLLTNWNNQTIHLGLTPTPPPPSTLIPHIEVGFKWMWTQLATPNKMAPVFVDLCAGLVVLLPRQIRCFRPGILFVSCPRLKLEELSSREAPLKATNRGQSTVSSSDLSFPEHRHYEVKPRCRSAGKATMVNLLTKQDQTSPLSLSLNEKFGLLKNSYRESHSLESDLYVRF